MTVLEAIRESIRQLEGVRLPVRDAENMQHLTTALQLLDAVAVEINRAEQARQEEGSTNE